jgi:hypothetical protein
MNRVMFWTIPSLGIAVAMACGCAKVEPKKQLSDGCFQNSDCEGSLICSFGHCHEQCVVTEDSPAGARCVNVAEGTVCQLSSEGGCEYNSDCGEPLVCGLDGECRNECLAARDCVRGQVCTTSRVCAELSEVNAENDLVGVAGASAQGGASGRVENRDAGAGGIQTRSRESGTGEAGTEGTDGHAGGPGAAGRNGSAGGAEERGSSGAGNEAGNAETSGTGNGVGNAEGGGTSGTGGGADDDDDNGTGGSAEPQPVYLFTFTSIMDVNRAEPATSTPVENDLTLDTEFTLDDTDGAPAPSDAPSMKIVAPFSAFTTPDQAVDFQFQLEGAPVDLTGKTLFLYLKFDSGFVEDPSAPGGVIFYAKSGADWVWGQAPWRNLDPSRMGKWWMYTFKLADAELGEGGEKFDPSQVMSIGLKIDTGSPLTTASAAPSEGVFHLDSLGYVDDAAPLP